MRPLEINLAASSAVHAEKRYRWSVVFLKVRPKTNATRIIDTATISRRANAVRSAPTSKTQAIMIKTTIRENRNPHVISLKPLAELISGQLTVKVLTL